MIKKHINLTPKEKALYDATYDAVLEDQVDLKGRPYLISSIKLLLMKLSTNRISIECYSYCHDRLLRDFSVSGSLYRKYCI